MGQSIPSDSVIYHSFCNLGLTRCGCSDFLKYIPFLENTGVGGVHCKVPTVHVPRNWAMPLLRRHLEHCLDTLSIRFVRTNHADLRPIILSWGIKYEDHKKD
jgi:hypothetical protein